MQFSIMGKMNVDTCKPSLFMSAELDLPIVNTMQVDTIPILYQDPTISMKQVDQFLCLLKKEINTEVVASYTEHASMNFSS